MSKSAVEKVRKKRKRRGRKKSGKVVRLSPDVLSEVDKRKGRASYDAFFRALLCLPPRYKGKKDQSLQERRKFWGLKRSGRLFFSKSEARGAAVIEAVRRQKKTPERPILLWEDFKAPFPEKGGEKGRNE